MTQEEPREDAFYALRAKKRAEDFEAHEDAKDSVLGPIRRNYSAWIAEGEVPQIVLTELGRIENEEIFWAAVDWYFEEAHLHTRDMEEVALAIRNMRTAES